LKILVRGRKDRSAVLKAVETFYPNWGIRVESLGGVRGGRIIEQLEPRLEPFTIILSGRRDYGVFWDSLRRLAPLPPLVSLSLVDRADVRNARLEMIAHSIDVARALLRGTVEWIRGAYRFYLSLKAPLVSAPRDPETDNFFFHAKSFHRLPLHPQGGLVLAYKMREGIHEFYCGARKAGTARFMLTETVVEGWDESLECPSIDHVRMIENNVELLQALRRESVRLLRENAPDEAEKIVVPWSGGKDSTAALILALEAFGRDRVVAVNVDTGTEFPLTARYIEEVAEKLGVELVSVYAGLREAIYQRGLPRLGERWCTGLKLEALRRAISRLTEGGKPVVIVGDRDAESKLRVKRPQTRISGEEVTLAPLKLWGGSHVQLFLIWKGVPLNPLYEIGFYRIGCFICPSLRDWELGIIKSRRQVLGLQREKLFELFVKERYSAKRVGS